jgi:outer membrane lipoprotein LolB
MRGAVAAPRRTLGAVLVVLVLAGCVSVPRKPATLIPWPERRAQLQALTAFELDGRVAVAAGNEGFSAHLGWQQCRSRSTVDLGGPLGIGGVHVVANGQSLTVETSRGQKLTSAEARAELTEKLGFDPPLASLRYWVLGVPDPGQPAAETIGADHRLAAMQQDGWEIQYSAYLSTGGDWLPQRMTLLRGDVRVRLLVDRWQP